MKIIVEGPDGSGKSTLVKDLSQELGLTIISGKGPERYPGEISIRAVEWIRLLDDPRPLIFDRHPCISHPIYSTFTGTSKIPKIILAEFYSRMSRFSIVFTRDQGLSQHELKEYDTEKHVAAVGIHHSDIADRYSMMSDLFSDFVYDYRVHNIKDVMKGLGL